MSVPLAVSLLGFAMLAFATPFERHPRNSDVAITTLGKNITSTKGSGNVAAAGTLAPFGDIGIGCGINWETDVSYGGGLTAGSSDYGLGGGFTITPEALTIGAGIGIDKANTSASIAFTGAKNGSVELVFESSTPFTCTPGERDGMSILSCRTV